MSASFRVNSWEDVPRAIALAESVGSIGLSELLRALRDGKIAMLPLIPETSCSTVKAFFRGASGRPAVIVIGDDDGMDRGPAQWPLAARVLRWANGIMIHATGAERSHYRAAVAAAALCRRVAIIECNSATLDAWTETVKALCVLPATLIIRPPRGGVHPIPLDGGRWVQ